MKFERKDYEEALKKIEQGFGCDMAYYNLNQERDMLNNLIDDYFKLKKEKEFKESLNAFVKTLDDITLRESYFGHILKAIINCEDTELQENAIAALSKLKHEVDNPEVKFEEIKDGEWLWDNKTKRYIQVKETFYGLYGSCVIILNCTGNKSLDYEKNRFYLREIKDKKNKSN